MKNIFGMFTSEDDEREYEKSLEKDLENNHLHHNPNKLHTKNNEIKSGDVFLSTAVIKSKKFQG